jgi:hypothetical protein
MTKQEIDELIWRLESVPASHGPVLCQLAAKTIRELRAALTESLKLQSHYAGLLNTYDGGKRMQFADNNAWLERLRAQTASQRGEK